LDLQEEKRLDYVFTIEDNRKNYGSDGDGRRTLTPQSIDIRRFFWRKDHKVDEEEAVIAGEEPNGFSRRKYLSDHFGLEAVFTLE